MVALGDCGIELISVLKAGPSDRKPNCQTVRIPFAGYFAAKAADYGSLRKLAAEPLTCRLTLDVRATALYPCQREKAMRSAHVMSTWPVAVDNAPYLAALVANSCKSNAKLVAKAAETGTSGPLMTMRRAQLFASS